MYHAIENSDVPLEINLSFRKKFSHPLLNICKKY